MTGTTQKRRDAVANRDRILDAARDALVADSAASLNAIAKAAAVGPGTLYRHFPSRDALVVAVYRKEIDDLVALAPALLAKHPPGQAFQRWCKRLAQSGRTKHAVAAALDSVITAQDTAQAFRPILAAVRELIAASVASGDIRTTLDAEEFLTLIGFVWRVPPDAQGKARVKKLLRFVFQGLRGGQ